MDTGSAGAIADLIVDCDGNFIAYKFTDTSLNDLDIPWALYKYDVNGRFNPDLDDAFSVYISDFEGGIALVGSEFYLANGYRVPSYSTDSVSIVSGLITPSNVTFVSNTPKLPQFGRGVEIGDMASSSEPVKLPTVSISSSQIKLCLEDSALANGFCIKCR